MLPILVVGLLVFSLFACAPASTAEEGIVIVIAEDPPSFNPAIADTGYDYLVMELVMLGLTDIDPFVLNIAQGGVANMSSSVLGAAVLIAAASNNVAKAAYTIGFGGVAAARRPALLLLLYTLDFRGLWRASVRSAHTHRLEPELKT